MVVWPEPSRISPFMSPIMISLEGSGHTPMYNPNILLLNINVLNKYGSIPDTRMYWLNINLRFCYPWIPGNIKVLKSWKSTEDTVEGV